MDKLERANQWLAVLTNVGVIVGLIFLTLEISQNTVAIENQIDASIWSAPAADFFIIEYPELAELSVRARTEPWNGFTPVEQERIGLIWGYALDSAELQFRLRNRTGEKLNAANINFPETLLSQDSFRTWWEQVQFHGVYPPEFVEFFDSYVSEKGN